MDYFFVGISNFHFTFPSFLNLTLEVTSLFCQQKSPLLDLGPAPAPGGHRSDNEMVISSGAIDQIMRWS